MSIFKERLALLRENKKLFQKDVASAISIPLRTYQSYERAEREPPYDILIKLANYFDTSIDYLLGETDDSDDHAFQRKQKRYENELSKILEILLELVETIPDNLAKEEIDKIIKSIRRLDFYRFMYEDIDVNEDGHVVRKVKEG